MKYTFKIVVFILIAVAVFLLYNSVEFHKIVSINDVELVKIWGHTERIADEAEKEKIINWFNSIEDIRKNNDFAGVTPESGIIIKLKSGSEISILKSGSDFEVQRRNIIGKKLSYWGRQPDIRNILYSN